MQFNSPPMHIRRIKYLNIQVNFLRTTWVVSGLYAREYESIKKSETSMKISKINFSKTYKLRVNMLY